MIFGVGFVLFLMLGLGEIDLVFLLQVTEFKRVLELWGLWDSCWVDVGPVIGCPYCVRERDLGVCVVVLKR